MNYIFQFEEFQKRLLRLQESFKFYFDSEKKDAGVMKLRYEVKGLSKEDQKYIEQYLEREVKRVEQQMNIINDLFKKKNELVNKLEKEANNLRNEFEFVEKAKLPKVPKKWELEENIIKSTKTFEKDMKKWDKTFEEWKATKYERFKFKDLPDGTPEEQYKYIEDFMTKKIELQKDEWRKKQQEYVKSIEKEIEQLKVKEEEFDKIWYETKIRREEVLQPKIDEINKQIKTVVNEYDAEVKKTWAKSKEVSSQVGKDLKKANEDFAKAVVDTQDLFEEKIVQEGELVLKIEEASSDKVLQIAAEDAIKSTEVVIEKEVKAVVEASIEKIATESVEVAFEVGVFEVVMIVYACSAALTLEGKYLANHNGLWNWVQAIGNFEVIVFGSITKFLKKWIFRPINYVVEKALSTLKFNINLVFWRLIKDKKNQAKIKAQEGLVEYYNGNCWTELLSTVSQSNAVSIVVDFSLGMYPNIVYGLANGNILLYDYSISTWTTLRSASDSSSALFLFARFDTSISPIKVQVVAGLTNGDIIYYNNNVWTTLFSNGYLSGLAVQFPEENSSNDLRMVSAVSAVDLKYYSNGVWNSIPGSDVFNNVGLMSVQFLNKNNGASSDYLIVFSEITATTTYAIQYYDGSQWTILYSPGRQVMALNVQFPSENNSQDLRFVAYLLNYAVYYYYSGSANQILTAPDNYNDIKSLNDLDGVSKYPICVDFPTGSADAKSVKIVVAILYNGITYYNNGVTDAWFQQPQYTTTQVTAMKCQWQTVNPLIAELRVVTTFNDGAISYYPETVQTPCWISIAESGKWLNQLGVMDVSFNNWYAPIVIGGLSVDADYQSITAPYRQGAVEFFNGQSWKELHGVGYNNNAASMAVQWSSEKPNYPLQVVYGLSNGAIELYESSTDGWTELHDASWGSSAAFLFADFVGSDLQQVVVGLLDQRVEVYNMGTAQWSDLASTGSVSPKTDLMQMAVQFGSQNSLNDFRFVIAANVKNENQIVIKGYSRLGSWVTLQQSFESTIEQMIVYFPTNSDSFGATKVVVGLSDGSAYYSTTFSSSSNTWVNILSAGKSKNGNYAVDQIFPYFPNDGSPRFVITTILGNWYIYAQGQSYPIINNRKPGDDISGVVPMCAYFPPNDPYGVMVTRTVASDGDLGSSGIDSYTSNNNGATLTRTKTSAGGSVTLPSKSITIQSMQCSWQFTDSTLPTLRIVAIMSDFSIQYFPAASSETSKYWGYIQEPGEFNNQMNVVVTNFMSNSNAVALVGGLSD